MNEDLQALLESIDAEVTAMLGESTKTTVTADLYKELFGESTDDTFDLEAEVAKLDGDNLEEATVMKLDAKAQLKKQISIAAINIAKEEAPQVYAKYKAAQSKKVALEELMIKKFRNKAIMKVKAAKAAA